MEKIIQRIHHNCSWRKPLQVLLSSNTIHPSPGSPRLPPADEAESNKKQTNRKRQISWRKPGCQTWKPDGADLVLAQVNHRAAFRFPEQLRKLLSVKVSQVTFQEGMLTLGYSYSLSQSLSEHHTVAALRKPLTLCMMGAPDVAEPGS